MTWTYAYTPHILPSVATILLLLALAVYSWHRRSVPGTLPFAIYCLLAVPMLFFKLIGYLAVDLETKIFWFKFEASFWIPMATALTCFTLEYTHPGRWLSRRNLVLLSIVPALSIVLSLSNSFHHLSFRGYGFNGSVVPLYGPVGWAIVIYGLGLIILNFIVFGWLFIHSPQHRWPVVLILTAQLIVRILLLIDPHLQDSWFFYMPEVSITVAACAIGLFGFRIFDPIPMARRTVINQMHDGVLVLDPQGRVAGLNPAAERIFHLPVTQARGKPVRSLLPVIAGQRFEDLDETEITFGSGQEMLYYQLTTSALKDYRGLEIGRLLLLHNMTAQKQAQAQIIEQQRALAMLREREQLARELHDSLGQVLGYASFQVDAAAKLSRDGQGAAAAEQLERLGGVIREAHADVREYILDLHTAPSQQQPFFIVLEQYLKGFTNNYGIQTYLSIGHGLGDQIFSPEDQLQVFRILQEALSNTRKHSRARQVQVMFALDDGNVCLVVQDDGGGFVPEEVRAAGGQHFGLRFMQERAEQLGGSLQVQSAPGAGTRVTLEVPVNGDGGMG